MKNEPEQYVRVRTGEVITPLLIKGERFWFADELEGGKPKGNWPGHYGRVKFNERRCAFVGVYAPMIPEREALTERLRVKILKAREAVQRLERTLLAIYTKPWPMHPPMSACTFEIQRLEEETSYRDELDEGVAAWITQQLRDGNPWAWCAVRVRCTWTAPDGAEYAWSDYLGGCSYDSADAFKDGGYYDDMKRAAYEGMLNCFDNDLMGESV